MGVWKVRYFWIDFASPVPREPASTASRRSGSWYRHSLSWFGVFCFVEMGGLICCLGIAREYRERDSVVVTEGGGEGKGRWEMSGCAGSWEDEVTR